MKRYITGTADTCWRDCIGQILEVDPERVPNFVKLYGDSYMDRTRVWLRGRGKGIVYIPSKNFMETVDPKFNCRVGPEGYSIGYLTMVGGEDTLSHVVICLDGVVDWDNGDRREEEYGVLCGYFIIYDLDKRSSRGKRQ